MIKGPAAALHQTIAALYDGVFGIPFGDFQRFALDSTRALVAFDSALWINGVDHADQVHSCLLVNQPADLIDRYLAGYADIDLIRHAAVRAPGRAFRIEDVASLDDFRRHRAYLEFWHPAGVEHAMAIAAIDPISQLMELIVLWRADRQAAFSADDVAIIEAIAPTQRRPGGIASSPICGNRQAPPATRAPASAATPSAMPAAPSMRRT